MLKRKDHPRTEKKERERERERERRRDFKKHTDSGAVKKRKKERKL